MVSRIPLPSSVVLVREGLAAQAGETLPLYLPGGLSEVLTCQHFCVNAIIPELTVLDGFANHGRKLFLTALVLGHAPVDKHKHGGFGADDVAHIVVGGLRLRKRAGLKVLVFESGLVGGLRVQRDYAELDGALRVSLYHHLVVLLHEQLDQHVVIVVFHRDHAGLRQARARHSARREVADIDLLELLLDEVILHRNYFAVLLGDLLVDASVQECTG